MSLNESRDFVEVIKLKLIKLLGWALVQWDQCPHKKGTLKKDMQQGEGDGNRGQRSGLFFYKPGNAEDYLQQHPPPPPPPPGT